MKILSLFLILFSYNAYSVGGCYDLAKAVVKIRFEKITSKKLNRRQKTALANIKYNIEKTQKSGIWKAYPYVINESIRERYPKDHKDILNAIFPYNPSEGNSLTISVGEDCANYIPDENIMNCLGMYGKASIKPKPELETMEQAAKILLVESGEWDENKCTLTIKDGAKLDHSEIKFNTEKDNIPYNTGIKNNDLIITFLNLEKTTSVFSFSLGNSSNISFDKNLKCKNQGYEVEFIRNTETGKSKNFCKIKQVLKHGVPVSKEEYSKLRPNYMCKDYLTDPKSGDSKTRTYSADKTRTCYSSKHNRPIEMNVTLKVSSKSEEKFKCLSNSAKPSIDRSFDFIPSKKQCIYTINSSLEDLAYLDTKFEINNNPIKCSSSKESINDSLWSHSYFCDLNENETIIAKYKSLHSDKDYSSPLQCEYVKEAPEEDKITIKSNETNEEETCQFSVFKNGKYVKSSELEDFSISTSNGQCKFYKCTRKRKEAKSEFTISFKNNGKAYSKSCTIYGDLAGESTKPSRYIPPLPPTIKGPYNIKIPDIPILLGS